MPNPEQAQGFGVTAGSEACSRCRHDALDLDAEAAKEAQGVEQKAQARTLRFSSGRISQSAGREWPSTARCTYSPSDPAGAALPGAVAGDPVTNPIEPAEFFDADVDDLVGSGALVATDRLGGLERGKPVEAKAPEIRLTVAGETPTSAAICSPVWRRRR